jgi:hypothetical protein
MDKYIEVIDGKIIRVFSNTGKYLWSYNPDCPELRFGIEREKTICGYKFTINDDGSSTFMYVGSDSE